MNSDSLTSLLIWMSFIFFSCPIALARTSSIMLNRSNESEHPFHFLQGVPPVLPIQYDVACGFVIDGSIILRHVSLMSSLLRLFIIKGYCILLSAFSASIEMIIWFLFLILFT